MKRLPALPVLALLLRTFTSERAFFRTLLRAVAIVAFRKRAFFAAAFTATAVAALGAAPAVAASPAAASAATASAASPSRFPAFSEAFDGTAFRAPDVAFRSVPFYSLNDELDPSEIDRQLRAFKEGGFGGSFLHSRIGLLTPYLGEAWWKAMTGGVRSSQALGIDAWFYDEDKWPSGFAGGIVPLKDPSFRARSLVRVPKATVVKEPDSLLFEDDHFRYVCRVAPLGDAWFNGTSWVDLMNPDMVRAFIDCSYEPYVKRYGGQPRVIGMFTDEPQIKPRGASDPKAALSYSPHVARLFKERTGRDLAPLLPSLFAEVGDWRRVRLDYYRAVAAAFEQAFSKQIGDYCAANGFVWTGHYNGEDAPMSNMENEGNLMVQLRHMQMPGIDALGLRYQSVHCAKVMTSVANQYDRPRRLSELFGISGHNMTFEDRMWITAWHTIMGVNFMCPHLSLYSMKGERKRDYPPTISPHQPYWRYNTFFEDYSARLSYFATVGRTVPELCVLHPIESNYIERGSAKRPGSRDGAYAALLNALMRTHRNFDLGDEQILADIARVEKGRLVVGAMSYRAVVVPEMLTIRPSTLALLERFAAQGGAVFVSRALPELVDGATAPDALARLKAIATVVTGDAWAPALDKRLNRAFALAGEKADAVWTHLRSVRGGHTLQLSNTSRREDRLVRLSLAEGRAPVALWNPIDGRRLRLRPAADGTYALAFAPAQTWIVAFGECEASDRFDADYALPGARSEVAALAGVWRGHRVDPNSLTLDFARYSTDGGVTWSEPEPVLGIHERFAREKQHDGDLRLKFEADIVDLPKTCRLAVEQPAMYRSIAVNGREVSFRNADSGASGSVRSDDSGPRNGSGAFICFTIRTQNIASHLKQGRNEIVLAIDYRSARPASLDAHERYGTEIESIYLVGDFAVKGVVSDKPLATTDRNREGALTPKPIHSYKSFSIVREGDTFAGDLVPQGYPFYAGEFILEGTFDVPAVERGKSYRLAFPSFEAIVIGIAVNGKTCAPLVANPWETDITAALKPGKNSVRLSLTNSLRNLMGPHHHKGGEHTAVGPATFRCNQAWPNKEPGEPNWYDARKTGKAKLWRDDTYLIPFGLLQPPVIVRVE